MSWLDELVVGSAVVVVDPRGHLTVSQVTAISKSRARITVGGRYYSGRTGREAGANQWSYWNLRELTPESQSAVIEQQRIRRARLAIDQAIDRLVAVRQHVTADNAYVVNDVACDIVERLHFISNTAAS